MDKAEMKHAITKAVTILQKGGLVAIPTETVYGLGADARQPAALQKIFSAKQRPMDHPLIVHLGDISELREWASEVPEQALSLARAFWPGPLTLILKKAAGVSDLITGGQDTIGLRIPNHPVALALLRAYGGGIAAPSANRFGRLSPTTAEAVKEELGDAVDYILEGGQCAVGVESTIVDMSSALPAILRPGMITADEIERVLQQPIAERQSHSPRVSGALESHYAPVTPVSLMTQAHLENFLRHARSEDRPFAVLSFKPQPLSENTIIMPLDPVPYAHDLYQVLRRLDKQQFKQIIIETVPETAAWAAIRDRLQRAASSVSS